MNKIFCLVSLMVFTASCAKDVLTADVSGSWKSLREAWTIIDNGASSKEAYDYGNAPQEESAILRIYHSSFYILDGAYNAGKSFILEYSDRFSDADEGTKERSVSKMSARLRKNKINGSTGETWVIRDVDGDMMSLDYDSGKKEGEVWRRCRFVFVKVGDTVVRE